MELLVIYCGILSPKISDFFIQFKQNHIGIYLYLQKNSKTSYKFTCDIFTFICMFISWKKSILLIKREYGFKNNSLWSVLLFDHHYL